MRAFFTRNLQAVAAVFRPPFEGLWAVLWLFFIWAYLVHPQSQILRGNLPDSDDYMYLNQVLDWLGGQGWFDNIQHRLDPPAGGPIHFSRIAQIPMAALVLLFERLGFQPRGAATLTAIVEPLLLLPCFFVSLIWAAKALMAKEWAPLAAFAAMFSVVVQFMPGHLDHHGLDILIAALALGCCFRLMQAPQDRRFALLAGALLALDLAIALETLPWVILISGWLGLWAILEGGNAARRAADYGTALFVLSAGFLCLAQPPSQLFSLDTLEFSVVYVLLTAGIAVALGGIAVAANGRMLWRWALGAGLAAAAGGLFLWRFPGLHSGPWEAINPEISKILSGMTESATLFHFMHGSWYATVCYACTPAIGLAFAIRRFLKARGGMRWSWGLMTAMLAAVLLLTLCYQMRYSGVLGMAAAIPLAALFEHGYRRAQALGTSRQRVYAEIGLLLLIGPLFTVLMPALGDGRAFATGVLLFPVHGTNNSCDMYGLERVLRAPALDMGRPRLIMSDPSSGPELLFRTTDDVLAAPYHKVIAGNIDAMRFLTATDAGVAETIARRRGVDLVVLCRVLPRAIADSAKKEAPDASEKLDMKDLKLTAAPVKPPVMPLAVRLVTGYNVPPWLMSVRAQELGNFVVYKMAPASQTAPAAPVHKPSE